MNTTYLKWALLLPLLLVHFGMNANVQAQNDDVPFYSQRDTDWAEENLGNSELKIGRYGCGLTSAAMVISSYDIHVTPLQLNSNLKAAKAFSGADLLWGAGEAWAKATYGNMGGSLKGTTVYWRFDEEVLKNNVSHGRPVIVYIDGRHYVVITSFTETLDQQRNKTVTQYYINDPWKMDYASGHSIRFEENALGIKDPKRITQMIILRTDSDLPANGILVDWPAIQDKYVSLGGLSSVLGPPSEDDMVVEDMLPLGTHRSQDFKEGKIYAYDYGFWRAYWLPSAMAEQYDRVSHPGRLPNEQFGDLVYDAYPVKIGGGLAYRADAENGSLIWYVANNTMDILLSDKNYAAEYYNNTNLTGSPDIVRYESSIRFSWGTGSPHPQISASEFSARYRKTINTLLPGLRTFSIWTSSGVRLYIDGEQILDRWDNDAARRFSANRWLSRGDHEIVYEYRHTKGEALIWATDAPFGVEIAWSSEAEEPYASLPAAAPDSSIDAPKIFDNFRNLIKDWWERTSQTIRQSIETWVSEAFESIRQQVEVWIREEFQQFGETLLVEFMRWWQQFCSSVLLLIIVVPVVKSRR